MKFIFSLFFTISILGLSAQSKEEKWKIYISAFQNGLAQKDKSKLTSLVDPKFDDMGSTRSQWISRIISNNQEMDKVKKVLSSKVVEGVDHDKMKCHGALCLYFDYVNGKWLLAASFED